MMDVFHILLWVLVTVGLVPRPSHHQGLDRLLYAKMERMRLIKTILCISVSTGTACKFTYLFIPIEIHTFAHDCFVQTT